MGGRESGSHFLPWTTLPQGQRCRPGHKGEDHPLSFSLKAPVLWARPPSPAVRGPEPKWSGELRFSFLALAESLQQGLLGAGGRALMQELPLAQERQLRWSPGSRCARGGGHSKPPAPWYSSHSQGNPACGGQTGGGREEVCRRLPPDSGTVRVGCTVGKVGSGHSTWVGSGDSALLPAPWAKGGPGP